MTTPKPGQRGPWMPGNPTFIEPPKRKTPEEIAAQIMEDFSVRPVLDPMTTPDPRVHTLGGPEGI